MTLPPRLPRKAKRDSRWRSPAHLSFVRSHHCCAPLCGGMPIEAAHVRIGSGAGLGQKPSDWQAISLCRECHAEQHRIGEASFAKRYGLDLQEITDAFAKASPKAAEIARVRKEREGG